MTPERWQTLMLELGLGKSRETYTALLEAHEQKHRHYHTVEHISACLDHLEVVAGDADNTPLIALAFWFHDAVYKPLSSTNERDSADWAIRFMTESTMSETQVLIVEKLIMATLHNFVPEPGDEALMIDIDLAILGSSAEVYKRFEQNVRKEYRLVPNFIFKRKRRELLKQFLSHDRIFQTGHFYDLYEEQARVNLQQAVLDLA